MRSIGNWRNRGLSFCRYADDCNIYVSSEAAAKRVLAGIGDWIGKRLRLQVNEAKSGRGVPGSASFWGFASTVRGSEEVAPQSVERFKQKVREICAVAAVSRVGNYATSGGGISSAGGVITGWPRSGARSFGWKAGFGGIYGNAFGCAGMTVRGRCRALRRLGVPERMLRYVPTRRGAWFVAARAMMHRALSKRNLPALRFVMPSEIAASR